MNRYSTEDLRARPLVLNGRKRVVALVEDDVETPSDMSGVLYISLSDTEWKQRVLREMEICGLHFDATRA